MLSLTTLETLSPDEFRRQLRRLVADRGSPEAAAMFQVLMRYAHKRVIVVSNRCGGRMPASRQEELVADILLQLMDGGLARFRGATLPELLAFVRTIADRTTWRAVRAEDRERNTFTEGDAELARDWTATLRPPDQTELVAETPLPEADQTYLLALLEAGSKAELARIAGVSRAAVTQRVQRIVARVEGMTFDQRIAHEVWLEQSARGVLERQAIVDG